MKTSYKELIFFSILWIGVACQNQQKQPPMNSEPPAKTTEGRTGSENQNPQDSQNPQNPQQNSVEYDRFQQNIESHTQESFSLQDVAWHPEKATVEIVVQPKLVSVSESVQSEDNLSVDDVAVPEVEVSREGASFLTVLRCDESVRIQEPRGDWADRLMQWNALFDDPKCRLIGTHILSLKIMDQTVDKGKYVYVLNPCVAQESSSIDKEDCSYRYVASDVVEVTKGWSQKRRELERDVMQIEAEVSALMHRWYTNIKRGLKAQQQCEYAFLDRQLANAHMRTWMYGMGAVVAGRFGVDTAVKSGSGSTGIFAATLVFAVLETIMRLADPGRLDPMWWDPSDSKCPTAETWSLENSQIQAELATKQRLIRDLIEKQRKLEGVIGQLDRQIIEEYLGEVFRTEGTVFEGPDPIKAALGATAKL